VFVQSIILIVLLVLLSALLSTAEASLIALTEARLRKYEDDGNEFDWSINLWIKNPQRLLATLHTGDAIVDVTATVLAAGVCSELYGPNGIYIAIAVMIVLTLILGKTLPKALGIHYAEQLAFPSIRFLAILYYPLSIFALPVSWLSNILLGLTGGNKKTTQITEEEIEYMIDLGAREGIIERKEGELLQSVLEFTDTVVREAMIPRTEMVALPVNASPKELIDAVTRGGHSRVPIFENTLDNVLGILHAKDLFRLVQDVGTEKLNVKPILRKPFFVPETMKISKLLEEFRVKRSHMAVVFDEFGGTAGIITLEDVLEEIVGDIQDEYDDEEQLIVKIQTGKFSVDARVSIAELEEKTGIKLPEEGDYDTLAGFITTHSGKVPDVGAEIPAEGFVIKVTAADGKRVSKVELNIATPTPVPPP
jgi:putative hemolysin